MKIFIASLGTETNTFSPFLTGLRNFSETYLVRGGNHGDKPFIFAIPLVVWRRRAAERGWSVVESLCTFAQPAGITLRSVYESLRDEILADLKAAMPVDMVLLSMHGAMVAYGYDDCEGDLLAKVREIVGPDVPVGAELDLHCHLTQTMIENATAIITFKEYPHIDFAPRAKELFQIIAAAAEGKVRPCMALYDCNMIGVYPTTAQPMRGFVDRLKEMEGKDGVISISIGHGFPWGDVPDMGTRVLVVTDNRPQHGAALAESLGQQFFGMREQIQPSYLTIAQALDRVLATEEGTVVLADGSDNAGGGAPSDSTFIIQALLERGVENAAVACVWDPIAVQLAMEAGEGAQFDLRLGGKMGPMSGDPLDLRVTVRKVVPDAMQSFGHGPDKAQSRLGDAVALNANSIDIVVNSVRTQPFSPEVFTNLGIDPAQKRVLVVKSMQHFYAGFAPIAAEILYVAAPGALTPDFKALPYQKVKRNMWPLSE
ncbi:MAG: M81 family metallopeptidase [Anaerolineales bacterium]|nr:M81 family metallopeptidase [Anaerolineales bacterium]